MVPGVVNQKSTTIRARHEHQPTQPGSDRQPQGSYMECRDCSDLRLRRLAAFLPPPVLHSTSDEGGSPQMNAVPQRSTKRNGPTFSRSRCAFAALRLCVKPQPTHPGSDRQLPTKTETRLRATPQEMPRLFRPAHASAGPPCRVEVPRRRTCRAEARRRRVTHHGTRNTAHASPL